MLQKATRFAAYAAVLFYVLCWLTPEPDKLVKITGISLPWFSIIISMPVMWIIDIDSNREGTIMTYSYIACTVVYAVVVSIMRMNIINQVPHLACCVCAVTAGVLYTASRTHY